jgi:hypothetical protein
MGIYYFSTISAVPLAIAYGLLTFVYSIIVVGTRGDPKRGLILSVLGAVFLVLPVSEELWIAWNFGQACKGAGTFITKKVQTDGFYDATMRSAYENTVPGSYRFVEQATEDRTGFERVERVAGAARERALAWYAESNPGKSLPSSVVYPVK